MADPNQTPIHESGQDARAGETTGRMRWVLLISITLAIVVLSLLVWGPTLFHQ
jgi:hypothetical protein